ncbi:MAG: helix-turn-helix domain-containing protein [Treponema sp.]|nr:helix-turn-helix domain-containing protein [Treponema sp.]
MNNFSNEDHDVMTRKQAAAYLQFCTTVLDRSNIPHIKFGRLVRYKKADIDKWIKEKAVKTGGTV